MQQLVSRILEGDIRALARGLTWVEDGTAQGHEALGELYKFAGKARIIGVTGSIGAGKSSLTGSLALELKNRGHRVGIVAVDPSSPFSHGALLGDRLRMNLVADDPNVFIRSMASRGSLGGLADTTADVAAVLDAAGYDMIIVETVGTGQDEVEVMNVSDTTLVVIAPGGGDDVQAIKAGIMEIADVLVMTKADLPGSDTLEGHLRLLMSTLQNVSWRPPLVKTSVIDGVGIDNLVQAVFDHQRYLETSDIWTAHSRNRARRLILTTARNKLFEHITQTAEANEQFESLVEAVATYQMDPHEAARTILRPYIA